MDTPSTQSGRPSIQGFICTWRGHERLAAALEQKLRPLLPVTVINTEVAARDAHPDWIHLGEQAYFSEQWNRIRELLDADVLFQIQADADCDRFADVIPKALAMFMRHPLGVYEPNVDYTDIRYEKARLRALDEHVFEVPWTDCTCWFVRRDVVSEIPAFDLSVNTYGWGICRAIAAAANLAGLLVVRDYEFAIRHPRRRGYPSIDAMSQMRAYLETFPPHMKAELLRLAHLGAALRPPRC